MRRKAAYIGATVIGGGLIALAVWGFATDFAAFGPRKPAATAQQQASGPTAAEFLERGNKQAEDGVLEAALRSYTRAIEIDPKLVDAYVRRATALGRKGDLDGEIADFTLALDLGIPDPGQVAEVYGKRGEALLSSSKSKEALDDFDLAIAINPGLTEAYYKRAVAKMWLGKFEDAVPDFERTLADSPGLPRALYGLGVIHYARRDWAGAIRYFEPLYEGEQRNSEAAMWLILAHKHSGDKINAAEYEIPVRKAWPGPVVAYVLGQADPLDQFMVDETQQNSPNLVSYTCLATFAKFSLMQIEKPKEAAAKDYLDAIQKTFDECAGESEEGKVGQMEIKYLKAR